MKHFELGPRHFYLTNIYIDLYTVYLVHTNPISKTTLFLMTRQTKTDQAAELSQKPATEPAKNHSKPIAKY